MKAPAALLQFTALVMIVATFPALAQPKIPPKYPAAPDEVLQLPKYCYNQYVDGSLGGYEYSIPNESCGYAMNHFCPGLVAKVKAQKMSFPKSERIGYIKHAIQDIDYTIREMKPGCFIAKDVFAAKESALFLSRIIK